MPATVTEGAYEGGGDLFDDIVYYVSPSLLPEHCRVVLAVMNKNGAKEAQRKDIRSATHIISESHSLEEFEFGEDSLRKDVAIVTPKWVWTAVWLGRLPSARGFSTDPRMIFSGVVGCSTDIPNGDREAIAAGIQSLGGQWRNALTKEVTHLFALAPGGEKYNSAMHYYKLIGQPCVVTPHWFDDSFKCQQVQPVAQYLFPDPPVLGPGSIISHILATHKDEGEEVVGKLKQALAGKFGPPKIRTPQEREKDRQMMWENAAAATAERLSVISSVQAQTGFQNSNDAPNSAGAEFDNLWDGRRIHISPTVNARLRGSIGARVNACGGIIIDNPKKDDFDILVTPHTGGPIYEAARQAKKLIGTIEWLFYCHSTGRIGFPDDHLLHTPRPIEGIAEFQEMTLTISGYVGLAREYIKTLLSRMGATVTPEMSHRSTNICVASKLNSTKTKHADMWNVPVVNHLWVEECFKQWRYVHPSVQAGRFTNYPPTVDYGNILGQRVAYTAKAESSELADHRKPLQEIPPEIVSESGASANDGGDELLHEAPTPNSPIISRQGSAFEVEQDVTNGEENGDDPLLLPATRRRPPALASDDEIIRLRASSSPSRGKTIGRAREYTFEDEGEVIRPQASSKSKVNGKARAYTFEDEEEVIRPQASPSKAKVNGKARPYTSSGVAEFEVVIRPRASSPKVKTKGKARASTSKGVAEVEEEHIARRPAAPSNTEVLVIEDDEDIEIEERSPHESDVDHNVPLPVIRPMDSVRAVDDSEDDLLSADQILAQSRSNTSKKPGSTSSKSKPSYKPASERGPADAATRRSTASPSPEEKESVQRPGSNTGSFTPRKRSGPMPKPRFSQVKTPVVSKTMSMSGMTPEVVISSPRRSHTTNSANPVAGPSRAPKTPKESGRQDASTAPKVTDPPTTKRRVQTARKHTSKNISSSKEALTSKAKSSAQRGGSVEKSPRASVAPLSRFTSDSVVVGSDDGLRSRRAAAVRASVGLAADMLDANQHSASLKASKGNIHKLSLGKRTHSEALSEEEDGYSEDGKSKGRHVKSKTMAKIVDIPDTDSETGSIRRPPAQRNTKIKILLTKAKMTTNSAECMAVKKLAGFTENPTECTHMVTSSISRTSKFVRAMNVTPFVLTPEWIIESAKAGRLLLLTPSAEEDFKLNDPDGEQKYQFILDEALERSKRGKLFAGYTIYVTPNVGIDLQALDEVVKSAGGKMIKMNQLQKRLMYKDKTFIVSSYEDQNLWQELASSGTPIYNYAFLLNSVLMQELDLNGAAETSVLRLEDAF